MTAFAGLPIESNDRAEVPNRNPRKPKTPSCVRRRVAAITTATPGSQSAIGRPIAWMNWSSFGP
jgi:hypothetical protein